MTGDTPTGGLTIIIAVVLYGVLALLDTQEIDKSGHIERARRLDAWWIVLIPLYLWRRGTLLKQGHKHVWLWAALFIVSVLITQGDVADFVMASAGRLPDCAREELQQRVQVYLDDLVGGHGLATVDVTISDPQRKSSIGTLSETCVYRATLPSGAATSIEILVTRTKDGFNYIAGDMHDIAK